MERWTIGSGSHRCACNTPPHHTHGSIMHAPQPHTSNPPRKSCRTITIFEIKRTTDIRSCSQSSSPSLFCAITTSVSNEHQLSSPMDVSVSIVSSQRLALCNFSDDIPEGDDSRNLVVAVDHITAMYFELHQKIDDGGQGGSRLTRDRSPTVCGFQIMEE